MKNMALLALGLIASVAAPSLAGAKDLQKSGSISVKGLQESQYSKAAKISMREAVDAALQRQKGQEVLAMLDTKDGYLVYEVKVLTPENAYVNVFVDAGNRSILGIKEETASG